MHELDDAALELRLREVLTERLGPLTLELTNERLERRRLVRERGRRRGRVLTGLALAAALIIPAGWLAAGAPLPRPIDAIVVTPPEPHSTEPTATTDPSSPGTRYRGVFVPVAPLAEILSLDRMSNLPDGRVLIFNSGDRPVPSSVLDLNARTITPTGTPIAWRSQPDVVGLPDGRVLVIGGDMASFEGGGKITDSTAELFDPASGTFSLAGPMRDSRWIAGVTTLLDGRVLIVGGIQPPGDEFVPLATAEIFDPRTNTFTRTGSMRDARVGPSVVALTGGLALVVAGRGNGDGPEVASAELYDASTATFTPVGPPPPIPPAAKAFRYPLSIRGPLIRLADGRALIVGLSCQEVHDIVDGESAGRAPGPSWLFDPTTRQFSEGPAMPHCVERAIALPNGEVLATGWYYGASNDGVRWAGLLDPSTGNVRVIAPPPGAQYMTWLLHPDGRVLVSGGQGVEAFE